MFLSELQLFTLTSSALSGDASQVLRRNGGKDRYGDMNRAESRDASEAETKLVGD